MSEWGWPPFSAGVHTRSRSKELIKIYNALHVKIQQNDSTWCIVYINGDCYSSSSRGNLLLLSFATLILDLNFYPLPCLYRIPVLFIDLVRCYETYCLYTMSGCQVCFGCVTVVLSGRTSSALADCLFKSLECNYLLLGVLCWTCSVLMTAPL